MSHAAAVVEGEAPDSDEEIDLSGQEATEDLYEDSFNYEDAEGNFDACEEVLEETNITPTSGKQFVEGNRRTMNPQQTRVNSQNRANVFSNSISGSSLRSLISPKSPSKVPPKYPGILHRQLRDKNLFLMKELTDLYLLPYRESTVKCTILHEESTRTLILTKEAVNNMKKAKFSLITACSRLEDALQSASSSQANWATD